MKHHIYVISESPDGPVKIGRSGNPGARMYELQTGNHRPLALMYVSPAFSRPDVLALERNIHASFCSQRIAGEWFDVRPQDAINALKAEIEFS